MPRPDAKTASKTSSRTSGRTTAQTPGRPPIWVDGRQSPRFKPGAWASVGERMARRWLAPHLDRSAGRLSALAAMTAAGRFALPLDRLGKAARFVPSRLTVGAAVAGLGARLAEARSILLPPPPVAEPPAHPNLIRPDFGQRPSRPAPAQGADAALVRMPRAAVSPDLRAIRAIIHEEAPADQPADQPPVGQIVGQTVDRPAAAPGRGAVAKTLARLSAHAIAWSALGLALPVGLVQATLFHLNGGDLTDWE